LNRAECVYVAPTGWNEFDRDYTAVRTAWQDLCGWLAERSGGRFQAALEAGYHQHEESIDHENVAQFCEKLHAEMGQAYRVFLVRGAGAYAGALWYGAAILGDACIDEVAGAPRPTACDELVGGDEWTCSRNGQIGAMLHELGHLYALEHEDGGFMQHYKTWPDVAIPQKARDVMFLEETPAETPPDARPWWRRLVALLVRPFDWLRRVFAG